MVSLHALYRRAEKLARAADELAAQRGRDDFEVKRASLLAYRASSDPL